MTGWSTYHEVIPEQVVPGKRLGRHILRDTRALAYPHPPLAYGRVLSDALHTRYIPILDQGNTGSCTGNAETGALGTIPVYDALPPGHPVLNEAFARDTIYHLATTLDGYPGTFPPDDTGSDGQSAAKAAQKLGLLSGYTWAATVQLIAVALQDGPVCIGINWYDSMDSPGAGGLITISPGAQVRGGHELVLRGVMVLGRLFRGDNSWGAWGDKGSFDIGWDDMARLLAEGGDATVPVPLTQPAPVPVPPLPAPVDDDAADTLFATVLLRQNAAGQAGVHQRHDGYATNVARHGAEWLLARGFTPAGR